MHFSMLRMILFFWALPLPASCFAASLPESLSRFQSYVAERPYVVDVDGQPYSVDVGDAPRFFDFGGSAPFVNPYTGVPDAATMISGVRSGASTNRVVLSGGAITNKGIPGRIEKSEGMTMIAYRAGDPIVSGACRAQLASYPVPSRVRLVWDLEFRAGGSAAGDQWPDSVPGLNPVLLWQLKAPSLQPSLAMTVDTDPSDPTALQLTFSRKAGGDPKVFALGSIGGIQRGAFTSVVMEVFLDEREVAHGGSGFWRVWVNGSLVIDMFGPTLTYGADRPHQWFLATYLYRNTVPFDESRVVFWRKARMLKGVR